MPSLGVPSPGQRQSPVAVGVGGWGGVHAACPAAMNSGASKEGGR